MAISEGRLRALLADLDGHHVATLSPDDVRALCTRAGGAIVELLAAMGEGCAIVRSASPRVPIDAMAHPHFDVLPSGALSAMPDAPAPMYRRVGWGELRGDRVMAFGHDRDTDKRLATALYADERGLGASDA